MTLRSRRYIHWRALLVGLAFALPGVVLAVDVLRGRIVDLSAWESSERKLSNQRELLDTSISTVTLRNDNIIAVSDEPGPKPMQHAKWLKEFAVERKNGLFFSSDSLVGVGSWEGKLVEMGGGLLLLWFGMMGLRQAYRARFFPSFNKWIEAGQPEAPLFAIEAQQLRLVRPYPFSASKLTGRTTVAAAEIVAIGSRYRQAVLKHGEIIFFPWQQREEVKLFAKQNSIPCVEYSDVWDKMMAPYYESRSFKADDIQELGTYGIVPAEAKRIWRSVRFWYYLQPWYWLTEDEDTVYNHYELLYMTGASLLPRYSWYWYTMSVALRGFPDLLKA